MWLLSVALAGWSLLAAAWWACALRLVCRRAAESRLPVVAPEQRPPDPEVQGASSPADWITVFKPLARLREAAPAPELVGALESFVAQTNGSAEVLFGVEHQDGTVWQPVFDDWRARYPSARFTVVCRPRPTTFLNPRGSWLHALAERARGSLWLWSDADIVAPPELLVSLRRERAKGRAGLVTCPYVVRRVDGASTWLEALFVNVEFYPGVLACRAWGRPRFGFGAGMLFAAEDFRQRLRWEDLGARMADDNLVGQRLGPAYISDATVETLAPKSRWADAFLLYLRRSKTVRWCRPAGSAAQVLVLPVLGWLGAVAFAPGVWWTWVGLGLTVALETFAAGRLCAAVQCPPPPRMWPVLLGWSVLRAITWLVCWLPWPVVFRSQRRLWWSLYRCSEGKP